MFEANTENNTSNSHGLFREDLNSYKNDTNRAQPLLSTRTHKWSFSFVFPQADILPPTSYLGMSGPTDAQKFGLETLRIFAALIGTHFCCILFSHERPWYKAAYISYRIQAFVVGYDLPPAGLELRYDLAFSPD